MLQLTPLRSRGRGNRSCLLPNGAHSSKYAPPCRPRTAAANSVRATKRARKDATSQSHRTAGFTARRLGAPYRAVLAGGDPYRGDPRALGRARYRPGAVDAGRRLGAGLRRGPCCPRAGVVIWREGVGGGRQAATALFIGFALIAYPLYLGIKASRLPAIYDITTDPIDPPQFDAIARLRPRDANPITYAGLYTAEQQHAAYSDIEPDDTNSTPQEAYDAAMKVITKRKWRVVDARPPQGPLPHIIDTRTSQGAAARDGIIEAVARTPILGFRDDVVVRVRATTDGARIDVRSASRYGRHDLGTNAKRVRQSIDDIDDVLALPPPGKKAPPAPPAAKAVRPSDRRRRSTAVRRSGQRRAHHVFEMRQN